MDLSLEWATHWALSYIDSLGLTFSGKMPTGKTALVHLSCWSALLKKMIDHAACPWMLCTRKELKKV